MRRLLALATLAILAAGCGSKPAVPAPAPALSLEGLTAQRLAVLPTFNIFVGTDEWGAPLRRSTATLRALDTAIVAALDERGIGRNWVFPPELERAYRHNPTYATDPYALGEEPLRSPTLQVGSRLPEPLASQLRTLVALTDTRFVLAPVELRVRAVPADPAGRGEGVLRLAVIDARTTEVVWLGEVHSDALATPGPALVNTLAARVADLFGSA